MCSAYTHLLLDKDFTGAVGNILSVKQLFFCLFVKQNEKVVCSDVTAAENTAKPAVLMKQPQCDQKQHTDRSPIVKL